MDTVIEIVVQNTLCCGCGVCIEVCQQQLLTMNETSMEGVLPVEVTP